jgi:chloramphenicol 3-O-phosphotransferase
MIWHLWFMASAVWLITGAQASGKSSVAEALAQRFERGVHVRGGQFYRWAVRGWVHFDDPAQPDEARRLLDLRYRLSAIVADEYAAAGFTTVVQDNIYGSDVEAWIARVSTRPVHLVVLRPSVEVLGQRHEERRRATGKAAYRAGFSAADNDRDLATTPQKLGLWLDSSTQSVEETVNEIVARSAEALVASDSPGD